MKTEILNWFISNGNASIVSIAGHIDMSVPTATKYLNELIKEGYVRNCGKVSAAKGRKPIVYGINPTACYFVGVDIRHFAVTITLIDMAGNIRRTSAITEKAAIANTPSSFEKICAEIRKFIEDGPEPADKVKMVSCNISGRVNSNTGYSYSVFNFEGNEAPLSTIMSEAIGKPVTIENDTRAMTYGEHLSGALGRYRNALFVNFNWGIGMGIIIDGKIYAGAEGYSGELGHQHVYDNEIICHCGKKGCLETEVSVSAVARKLENSIREGKASCLSERVLEQQMSITPEMLEYALDKEDSLTMEIMENTGQELGRHLANVINIFNPEAVIIGGFCKSFSSDFFITSIRQSIAKYALKLIHKNVVVDSSALKDKAGVLGACLNARRKYIDMLADKE